MKNTILICAVLSGLLSSYLNAQHTAFAGEGYTTKVIASGFEQPWAHDFLPNGDILVTERIGSIRVVRAGQILADKVENLPEVYYAGQGGLLDLMLDADFANNKIIYITYAHGTSNSNALRLVSARLVATNRSYQLDNIIELFTAAPLKKAPQHYSGRIAQMEDGTLLVGVGDGFDYREEAQKLNSHLGKIVRLNRDGSIPEDNPFVSRNGAKPEIWSFGHRNHQSLVIANGIVYQNEHGPAGGDEVNIIRAGQNYGWPVITRGRDYNGAQITPYTEYPGMQQPLVDWTPSIAPSSMAFHQGKLYVTALAEQSIRQLELDGENITDRGIVFPAIEGRIRDISSHTNGKLYVLTDGAQAQLIEIDPTATK